MQMQEQTIAHQLLMVMLLQLPLTLMVVLIVLARMHPLDEQAHAQIKQALALTSSGTAPLKQQ